MFNDIWSCFDAVEIITPLAIMPMTETERLAINATILRDMETALQTADDTTLGETSAEQYEYLIEHKDTEHIRNLWRELASANATIINDYCAEVPEEDYEDEIENLLEMIDHIWNFDDEELRTAVATDSQLRMFIRRHGLNPDRVRDSLSS
jgi:hypothetical protein